MSKKVWRSVKLQIHKRRREFIIDTVFTTVFWLVVHAFNNIFLVRLTLWQVALAAISGGALNLLLSGVYGQSLNWVRKRCSKR